jgi:hypothetical protein
MATDFLNVALDALAAKLAGITGLPVTRDPRNITPGCVLIGAPTGDNFTYKSVELEVPVIAISSGPGNLDALEQLLGIVAKVTAENPAMVDFRPTTVAIGGTDAPGYEMTIKMAAIA